MYKFLLCPLFCLILSFQSSLISKDLNDAIEIVYHIATMKEWEKIVKEQIQTIDASGLGGACQAMTVTVVGPEIEKVYPLFEGLSFREKIEIVHAGDDFHLYEFPGIEKVQEIAAKDPKAKILYMHSKGVTYGGSPYEKNINQWRRFMEYFNVTKWKNCVAALDEVDACGVDYSLSALNIYCFAGNFWWARGDYVKKCILRYDTRYDCEVFIGTGDPKVKNFLSSGSNPRLKAFFSKVEIEKMQLFPKGSILHKGVFHWHNHFYHDYYYRGL